MNLTAKREHRPTKQRISHARRCANAIDQIEPDEDSWEEDEIARMVQFSSMIGTDDLVSWND